MRMIGSVLFYVKGFKVGTNSYNKGLDVLSSGFKVVFMYVGIAVWVGFIQI